MKAYVKVSIEQEVEIELDELYLDFGIKNPSRAKLEDLACDIARRSDRGVAYATFTGYSAADAKAKKPIDLTKRR